MKPKKLLLILVAAAVAGWILLYAQKKKIERVVLLPADQKETHLSTETPAETKAKIKQTALQTQDAKTLSDIKSLNDEEKKSLLTLASIMAESLSSNTSYDQLTARLESLKLAPKAMIDQNQYTGKMTVVRTKKALPGTRYIHAQYFSGTNERPSVLQHLSFELKPGSDSFLAARRIVEKQFNISVKPETDTPSFVAWHTGGRTIWIKKMAPEDMKNDPFNSYDPKSDVGTIRIAVEAEIH